MVERALVQLLDIVSALASATGDTTSSSSRLDSPERHQRKKQRLSRTASTNEPVNSKGQYEREKKFKRRKKPPAGTSSTARSRDGVGLVLMAVGVNTVATTSKQHGRVALPRGKVPDAIDPFAFN
ncbi:hypothetical protein FA13DRAFT_1711207 [Coprinellus micaceus]|uniref:Uncharacterized protein n=1 Tax=Coprinellus micaceus TaxID=71717 RepID=A0A4Y7T4V8_COPMI|nr:hypothetical protein FA13DRAFT_1711207 [Coprinellus micaceus]